MQFSSILSVGIMGFLRLKHDSVWGRFYFHSFLCPYLEATTLSYLHICPDLCECRPENTIFETNNLGSCGIAIKWNSLYIKYYVTNHEFTVFFKYTFKKIIKKIRTSYTYCTQYNNNHKKKRIPFVHLEDFDRPHQLPLY